LQIGIKNKKNMVIWITGLSASGKTTLSRAFERKYKSNLPNMVLLDGDVIRQLYGNDLGYAEADRAVQIKRLHTLASFLEEQSIVVLVAALYSNEKIINVVGVDIPWNEPLNPDLVFNISDGLPPDQMAEILFNQVFNK